MSLTYIPQGRSGRPSGPISGSSWTTLSPLPLLSPRPAGWAVRPVRPDHDHLHLLLKAAPDRIHTLIPGLLVLDTVAQAYQLQEILVSSCGVREGYLHHRVLKGEAG